MNDFEKDLRAALRPEPPPPGFAAAVLARAAMLPATEDKLRVIRVPLPYWRKPAAWAVAAGLCLATLVPPAMLHHRQEQARVLEAKRQLLTALEVTRAKLRQTRERIQRNTRHPL